MNRVSSKIVLAFGAAALVAGLQLALVASVRADQIISDEFNIGFGYVYPSPAWTDTENAGNNSPTTQSSFEFSPAPTGTTYSGGGFTFLDRSLGGTSTVEGSGYVGKSGANFSVPITAKYTGSPIAGASNYRLMLEITSISIYLGSEFNSAGAQAQWAETTADHTGTSTLIDIPNGVSGAAQSLAAYTKMVWNPTDYEVALTGLNDTFTRTFTIPVQSGAMDQYADGLEVVGRVHLVYNAVPEPSTVTLLAAGLFGLLAYAWRKQK